MAHGKDNMGTAHIQMTKVNKGKTRVQMTTSKGKHRMHKWGNPNNMGKARMQKRQQGQSPYAKTTTGATPVCLDGHATVTM